jgi:hypothetical protein
LTSLSTCNRNIPIAGGQLRGRRWRAREVVREFRHSSA